MELFKNELVISKIAISVFVPYGCGRPVHKNRPTHGFAFNVDCDTTYHFDTGKSLTCHSGELIYLPRGSNYTVSSVSPQKDKREGVYAINFLILDDKGSFQPKVIKVKGKEEILSSFVKSSNTWTKRSVSFYEQSFIELYKIIKLLKKEAFHYSTTEETLKTLAPALKYIAEHYTQNNISAACLAQLCKVSEPYLRKLFNNAFSVSPILYIRNMRIKYAKDLLRSGELRVTSSATKPVKKSWVPSIIATRER